MRANIDFSLRAVGELYFLVPLRASEPENKLLQTNATGAFLWKQLQKNCTKKELSAAICAEYDIDDATALADITQFLAQLSAIGALSDD